MNTRIQILKVWLKFVLLFAEIQNFFYRELFYINAPCMALFAQPFMVRLMLN